MKKDFWLDEYLKMGTLIGMTHCSGGRPRTAESFDIVYKLVGQMVEQYQKAIKEGDGHARFK